MMPIYSVSDQYDERILEFPTTLQRIDSKKKTLYKDLKKNDGFSLS